MPSTTERGYGNAHQAERRRLQLTMDVEGATYLCARCHQPPLIGKGDAWDLGHRDQGSDGGPEHISCNRSAGAVNSHNTPVMTIREW